ncbi:MAG: hypothetical protein AB8F95_06465 [Bacteroidia bacterium]
MLKNKPYSYLTKTIEPLLYTVYYVIDVEEGYIACDPVIEEQDSTIYVKIELSAEPGHASHVKSGGHELPVYINGNPADGEITDVVVLVELLSPGEPPKEKGKVKLAYADADEDDGSIGGGVA